MLLRPSQQLRGWWEAAAGDTKRWAGLLAAAEDMGRPGSRTHAQAFPIRDTERGVDGRTAQIGMTSATRCLRIKRRQ